jgi:hypothetical protein
MFSQQTGKICLTNTAVINKFNCATMFNFAVLPRGAFQCQEDVFTINSPGVPPVPRLCGTNTGYHIYVGGSQP